MPARRALLVVLTASTVMLVMWASLPLSCAAATVSRAVQPTPDTIELSLSTPSLQIEEDSEGLHRLQIDGFYASGSAGDPSLPARVYNIALPPDVAWDSLVLEVVGAETMDWPGTYDVPPSPPALGWVDDQPIASWGENAANIEDGRNIQVYQEDAYHGFPYVTLSDTAQMGKWRYVRLIFRPVHYNPVTGRLRLAQKVDARITFDRDPALDGTWMEQELRDTTLDGRAAELFANYEQARQWYPVEHVPAAGQATNYVIITTNQIRDAVYQALADFVAHKQAEGHNVLVVTETQYESLHGPVACEPPCGRAERIRRWLKQNRPVYGIEYVLLIGNPDPDDPDDPNDTVGDVPMQMCWPIDPNMFQPGDEPDHEAPTDYYYADLSGAWDLDGDGHFGERNDDDGPGGIDFTAEVYVGRIPVYTGEANWIDTLRTILQKIIDYESSGDLTWRQSALLPMAFHAATYDYAYLGEHLIEDIFKVKGYTYYPMFQHPCPGCNADSQYDSAYVPKEDLLPLAVLNRWRSHPVGIVTWAGHGGPTGTGIGYTGCSCGTLFSDKDAPFLDARHPAFAFQMSCNNGRPESADNVGYALLKRGAIATVAASRVTNPLGGTSISLDFADSGSIGYYYVDGLTDGKPAGVALYDAKAAQGDGWGNGQGWRNLMALNLYGDPSTSILSGHPYPPQSPLEMSARSSAWGRIGLYWADASDNEIRFTVMRSTDGQNFLPLEPALSPGITEYIDWDPLTCGSTYYYKVRASNAYGFADSAVDSAVSYSMDPYEPDNTAAQASEIKPSKVEDGDALQHSFHIDGDEDWSVFAATKDHSYTISTILFEGENATNLQLYDVDGATLLAENTTCTLASRDSCIEGWKAPQTGSYYVRVRNRFGSGGCGDGYRYDLRVAEGGPAAWPAAPSNLVAEPQGHDSIRLGWVDNSDDEDGFKIERWGWEGIAVAQWEQLGTVGADEAIYTHEGLSCGQHYSYRVRAYNAAGHSTYTPLVSATTPTWDRYDHPLSGGDDERSLARIVAPDGVPRAHTFHDEGDEDWIQFDVTAGKVYSITTSDLGANSHAFLQLYDGDGTTLLAWNFGCLEGEASACIHWTAASTGRHYVRVFNGTGTGGCPGYDYELAVLESSGDPGWPAAPTNLVATPISQSEIQLSWADNSTNEEGFEIERWGVSLPPYTLPLWQQIFIAGPDDTGFVDAGLSCDQTYRYRVRAYNQSGFSAYTSVASAQTEFQDAYEPDDDELSAKPIVVNGGPQTHNFHDVFDWDWVGFGATAGETYTLTTSNLLGVDTLLELYRAGFPEAIKVAENDDCSADTRASCINAWTAPDNGEYLVAVYNAEGTGGCPGYAYDLTVVDSNLGSVLPSAPSGQAATAVSPYQVVLTWSPASTAGHVPAAGTTEGLSLQRWYGLAWWEVARLDPGVTRFEDKGLACNCRHDYRLVAYNASGESSSGTFSVTTGACPTLPPVYEVYLPLVLRSHP